MERRLWLISGLGGLLVVGMLAGMLASRAKRLPSEERPEEKAAPMGSVESQRDLDPSGARPPRFVEVPAVSRSGRVDGEKLRQMIHAGGAEFRQRAATPGAREKRLQRLPMREELQTAVEEAAADALGLTDLQKSRMRELRVKFYQERRRLYEDDADADRASWSGEDQRVAALHDQTTMELRKILGGQERLAEFKLTMVREQRRIVAERRRDRGQPVRSP
jgi:hypothetical protein